MSGRLGLPRSARLCSGGEFKRAFETRKAHSNALFRVHYAPSQQTRLGLAVSRRVSPRAVERNRIRRQIRESFRHWREALPVADYVVVARPEAAGAETCRLRQTLDQLWQRFSDHP